MFTLYARSGSGSAAVEALLSEVGAPYFIEEVPRGEISPTYLLVNPTGQVPSLRLLDDSVMTESAAMMIYIADLYPDAGMAPTANDPQRPEYLRWMLYFASTVYMADLRYFYPARHSTDVTHADAIKQRASEHMDRDLAIFATTLGEGPYILGNSFSAVDIYATMLVGWAPDITAIFNRHPNIEKLYRAVAAREKIAAIWARNEMPS